VKVRSEMTRGTRENTIRVLESNGGEAFCLDRPAECFANVLFGSFLRSARWTSCGALTCRRSLQVF
jgi:hypothetical protein